MTLVYRKGERPVGKRFTPYDSGHPVASGIADGDHWMDAWLRQMCTPWTVITCRTGISEARIKALTYENEMPTDDEIGKLAELWRTTPDGLRASIPASLSKVRHRHRGGAGKRRASGGG